MADLKEKISAKNAENKEKVKKEKTPMTRKKKIIVYLAIIVGILVVTNPTIIPFMPKSITAPVQNFITGIFGNMNGVAEMVKLDWSAMFQLVIMVIIMLLLRELVNWAMEKYEPKSPRAATMKHLLSSTMKYVFAFVGIFWALAIMGVDVSTLFASVGIMALVVGFGAESLIADVITGLFMIFENQYNIGDIIELDGYRGTVVNIAIRTTSIEDGGGNIKIFCNSDVRNIVNLTADSSVAVCDIPIPYEADIDEAEAVIERLCEEMVEAYPEIFKVAPKCSGVQALADSAVMLRVTANVNEGDRFKAARLINKKMKTGLEKAGMGAPYNQIVVRKVD